MSTTIEHDTQQPIESPTTTALAVVTKSIAEINAVESTIAELESKFKGVVFAVDTAEGMDEARKARAAIREPRYALQNIEKAVKSALNGLKTSVGEQTGPYITRIEAIEEPVHLQIKGQEDREAAEKQAKKDAESKRIAAVEERISDIRETVTLAAGKSSEQIQQFITELDAIAIDATFAEFQPRAETAKAATLVKLLNAKGAAEKLEEQQRELANERRLAAIRDRIQDIRALPNGAAGKSAAQILTTLTTAKSLVLEPDQFGELYGDARTALDHAIQTLTELHQARVTHEAEQAKLDADRRTQELDQRRVRDIQAMREIAAVAGIDASNEKVSEARRLVNHHLNMIMIMEVSVDNYGDRYTEANQIQFGVRTRLYELLSKIDEREQAEKAQTLHNERLEQIRGIERMLLVATRHSTLEGYDLAINELKALALTEEDYGTLLKDATAARDSTLKALREGRDALNLRLVEEAAAKAENERLAEANRKLEADRAELDHREQASKLAQETVVPPSDPAEATKEDAVAKIVADLHAPAEGDPTDNEIIEVVAQAFFVPETTAIEWIIAVADRQRDMVAA